jgi:hypothetical protein
LRLDLRLGEKDLKPSLGKTKLGSGHAILYSGHTHRRCTPYRRGSPNVDKAFRALIG